MHVVWGILCHYTTRGPMTNQSQILCGAPLGRGDERLYKWPRSNEQDGRHAHIRYGKNLKNLLLQNQMSYDLETWHVALETQALQSLYK